MQYNINTSKARTNSFATEGGVLTTELYLAADPSQSLEAATKRYVDSKILTITASNVTSGTMPIARFPGYDGDISNTAGSNVLNLKNSGVTAGAYPKVTVTTKGIVTQGAPLTSDDIPNLTWSKVSLDRPTTTAGFGISDALTKSGGSMTGFISVMNAPTQTLHAANKSYVDNSSVASVSMAAGTEIIHASSVTPSGFLRSNGATVLKANYPNLYSVIGDSYTAREDATGGRPWQQQYQINTATNPTIWPWGTDTNLPSPLAYSSLVVTKNRVYLLGGINTTQAVSTIYTAPINPDGTLGGWTTAGDLPEAPAYLKPVVTKNRIYLLSGYYTTVYTAPINADGTIGTWDTSESLPGVLTWSHIIKTRTRLYVAGGRDASNNPSPTAYFCEINADGTLGSWYTIGSFLPAGRVSGEVIVTKNRVYIVGGYGSIVSGSSITASISPDGTLGAWTSGPTLPISLSNSVAIVTRNRVYMLGGYSPNSAVATSYTAIVNADGTLGNWQECQSLPLALESGQAFLTSAKLYYLGGYNGSAVANVYRASFSGGSDDYSQYYNGTFVPTNDTEFSLPDRSLKETADFKYYIKY